MKNFFLKIIYKVLAAYARQVIKKHKPFVIGITGSVGKGSTKETVYQVLHDHFGNEVRKNHGSLNAEIGIPLTILGYEKLPSKFMWPVFLIAAYARTRTKIYPKYLILEMGVEHKGDLKSFSQIVRPDLGVITYISPAHTANFDSLDDLVAEKLSMVAAVKPGGTLLTNVDVDELAQVKYDKLVTIGIDNKAQYMAEDIKLSERGTEYRIVTTGQKIAIKSHTLGKHLVYADLFAFAIGQLFGIQSLEIKKSLEKIAPIPGRMNLISGVNKMLLIDDTYNSNPAAVKAAMTVLSDFGWKGRKIAILGNMNELGDKDLEYHLEVARFAIGKCDKAIFVGPNASQMAKTFGEGAVTFADRKTLILKIAGLLKPHDLVLLKGSQNGVFLEEVTKLLMKDPTKAHDLLVRQSSFWLKKKQL